MLAWIVYELDQLATIGESVGMKSYMIVCECSCDAYLECFIQTIICCCNEVNWVYADRLTSLLLVYVFAEKWKH